MLQQIWSKIVEYDKIIIHRHINPDPDALGSQLGLAILIRHHYPGKTVKAVGFNEPSLSWMGAMDEIADETYKEALVIVTDTANQARIDDARYKLGSFLIKIDHHPLTDEYGDLNLIDEGVAATCELIVRLAAVNRLEIPTASAELLYAGLVSDSGRFLYDSTTAATFECAKILRHCQIDINKIHHHLYERPLNVVQAEAYVLNHFKVTLAGVAYFMMTQELQQSFQLTTGTRAPLANTLADIEGIQVRVSFFENEDGQIRANLRSNGPIINEVASQFNGGGHPKAAGAMLASWDECHALIAALNETIK